MTKFDYSLLRGRVYQVCGNFTVFAERMGVNPATVSGLFTGAKQWNTDTISKACEILGIKQNEIGRYFFDAAD